MRIGFWIVGVFAFTLVHAAGNAHDVPLEPIGDIIAGEKPITMDSSVVWKLNCTDLGVPDSKIPKNKHETIEGVISMRLKGRLKVNGSKATLEGAVVELVGPRSRDLVSKTTLPPIQGEITDSNGKPRFSADISVKESTQFSEIVLDASGATDSSWIADRKDGYAYFADCRFERAP